MIELLDARAARRWAIRGLAALGDAREEIDALNVYPVPDGDTGTNLYLTLESACAAAMELSAQPSVGGGLQEIADAFARGALLGARGNSGIILAQYLQGWAQELVAPPDAEALTADGVKRALCRADEQAWAAVGRPVEGTILSVSRAAAHAAAACDGRLAEVVSTAAGSARTALERTPEQLEVLRRAGVVDAGGRGLVVLLDTLEAVVLGRSPRRASRGHRGAPLPAAVLDDRLGPADASGPVYEVMFLLDALPERLPGLRARLAALGDSLAVVGGDGLWHVHVHVNDPGAAVEAGIEAGRPHRVRISRFDDGLPGGSRALPKVTVGLVACAAGPGLASLFEQAGAVVVVGGPARRPSTGELLDAVHRTRAEAVVVLPNDPDTLLVARAAAEAARQVGLRVSVLPTRAQVHGLAAAAVHDPGRRLDDDLVRMSAAAGACRDGAVTVALGEAITTGGVCRAGDVLGVVQGDVVVVGDDPEQVAAQVLDRLLLGGGELVTLVVGEQGGAELVTAVTERLRRTRRDLEVCVHDGGQPRYPLLIGVE